MQPTYPKQGTQYDKVLQALLAARGDWVSGNYFLHTLYLSQFHAKIFVLENDYHWVIEHSTHRDQFDFKEYRIVPVAALGV